MKTVVQKLNWKKIVAGFVALAAFLLVLLYINDFEKAELISTVGQSYERGTVTSITKDNLQEDGNRYGNQEVVIRIDSGSLKGQEVEATSPSGTLFGADCTVGMPIIAIVSQTDDNVVATIYSRNRIGTIIAFIIIFICAIILIGGKKGVKAVFSLAFTLVCILYLMFPLIYKGYSPFWVAVLVAVATTIITLTLVSGINFKSLAAILGTALGVITSGVAATAFGHFAGISGYNVSDIESLNYVAQYSDIQIGGLLFAGIIISALGAVMDVGMSISSTMAEIYEKKPDLSRRELFLSGIHVGRDMMGTMSNTLILAYVGGSITTLMLNYAYNLSANQLVNSYNIGIEIMQGLSGSLGVVLTVPITAALAAIFLQKPKTNS